MATKPLTRIYAPIDPNPTIATRYITGSGAMAVPMTTRAKPEAVKEAVVTGRARTGRPGWTRR